MTKTRRPTIEFGKSTVIGVVVAVVAAFAFLVLVDIASAHEVPVVDLPECNDDEVLVQRDDDGAGFAYECFRIPEETP